MRRNNLAFGRNLLAVVAAWATIGIGSAAAADSPWLYGVHFYGDPGVSTVETMTGGKGIWTLEIVVPNSDPWWGAAWQRDSRFQHIVNQGHTIICRIEPQWGYAVPKEPDYPMSTYLPQVTAAATALQDVVHIWHVGNEMNLTAEWGDAALSPSDYVDAFKQIRAAIKAVPSSLGEQIVLLGPLSPGAAGGARHMDSMRYLAEMCALVDDADFDGFAIHAYGAPWAAAAAAREEMQMNYMAQLGVIDHFGFAHKPVYLTEWNRSVTQGTAANEAQSAQFLHGVFADMHAWNQRANAHPIRCACWFIYQYDNGGVWTDYSIDYLHTVNPPGADNDLYDAFTYACAQNYPAGAASGTFSAQSVDEAAPGTNVALAATITADSGTPSRAIDGVIDGSHMWSSDGDPVVHWLQFDLGAEAALSGFNVYHTGYIGYPDVYTTQVMMLETAPTASGPWTIQDVIYNDADVTQRRLKHPRFARHVRLSVPDGGRDPFVKLLEVQLLAITPGDFDEDGDVDLHDAAEFQRHFGGPGAPRTDAAHLWAHFDEDSDVDAVDANGFLSDVTGP